MSFEDLNAEQQSAVLCKENKILCLAGAGTGKTTCMLERISHLVDTGVDPSSILVLTFTNAAAFEMKDRYKRNHRTELVPDFRTFHAFCYYVLSTNRNVRSALGYLETPTIADDAIRKRIIKEAGSITNIRTSIESFEKKKSLSVKEQYEYSTLKKAASKLMKKRNTITFDELCTSICKLFTEDDPCVYSYKQKYKYIFVDEFQDTDPTQSNFMHSFTDSNIFVVGDAQQAIYSFRGADSSIIKGLSTNPDWHTIKLFQNYRSPKTICDFANLHSRHAESSFRVEIQSGKHEEGDPVVIRPANNYVAYGDVDLTSLKYAVEDIQSYSGSTALLCRTNKEVETIQDYFKSYSMSYRSANKTVDVKNILTAVGNNEYLVDWLASYLNTDRYAEYIRLSTISSLEDKPYDIIAFMRDFGQVQAVSERWELVRTIRRICKDTSSSIAQRCQDILSILECPNLAIDITRLTDMKSAVDYLIDVYEGNVEAPGTDVYIGTIHSVKGLEFDNVYVFGVNSSTFMLNGEDNKNLYYVAITRAKKHLVVFEREYGF